MSLSKEDFDRLDCRIKQITEQPVEQIEVDSELPPTLADLKDNNKTYSIMAAILFVDIRKSTLLTEASQPKTMVKIYRSFMRASVDCVRKSGGVTRQFLGDRIMGVFIDSTDDQGNITYKAVDKAIDAARSISTSIDYSVNNYLKANVNGKVIECGIGIDYGKVLVTQVGMYGVESDEEKENEIECDWVGNITNYASKFSDTANGGEIFISERVYQNMSDCYKNGWESVAKYKGALLLKGYIIKDYYLEFAEQLGEPNKPEQDDADALDTYKQLANAITEFQKLQEGLIQREKELAVLESKLTEENRKIKDDINSERKLRADAELKRSNLQKMLGLTQENFFEFMCKLINYTHCKNTLVVSVEEEYWNNIIEKYFDLGRILGKDELDINGRISCGLIAIYSNYKRFDKSYDAILAMAEKNSVWVNLEDNTMMWAKENYKLHLLQSIIEKRLANGSIEYEYRNGFQLHLHNVKKLRGI